MRMTARVPLIESAKKREWNRGGYNTLAKSFLHFSTRCAIVKLPRSLKFGTHPENISCCAPFQSKGRALSRECDPKSGQHVQDVAQRTPKQAFQTIVKTSAEQSRSAGFTRELLSRQNTGTYAVPGFNRWLEEQEQKRGPVGNR